MKLAFSFAVLTGVGMLAGVWVMRRFEAWAVRHSSELIAFAAGLLVSGALLHLILHSIELAGSGIALITVLLSFIAFYLLEAHFIPHVHGRGRSPLSEAELHRMRIGPVVVAGLAVHSLVDGLSVGAGLATSAFMGWVTVLLVFVHKMPVGIASMSALYHSGVPGRKAFWVATALAMVTPVAVLGSYFALRGISSGTLGVLLALSGGSFLYVGAADLLPEGQARGRPASTMMFLSGIALMALLRVAGG